MRLETAVSQSTLRSRGRCLLALLLALTGGCLVAAQEVNSAGGPIERLTPETRDEALACGRVGPECAVTPYALCRENVEYDVRLVTPFSRMAAAALDEKEGRRPLGRMGPATVNRWGVALVIAPKSHGVSAGSIAHAAIQRDGLRIEPVTATVGPVTTEAADGTIGRLNRGFFMFPAATFEASTDVAIVLTGSQGETRCTLSRNHLRRLR